MKTRMSLGLVALLVALSVLPGQAQGPEVQAPLGNGFSYQGQLRQGGSPYSGTCDFQFSLWDDSGSGSQIGTTQTRGNVSVARGLFTVQVDFGVGVFRGDARWLGIKVRCPAGSGSYTTLSPRQALTPAPYALALPGLWTEMNATSPNIIGGYSRNTVTAGAYGATIGGGGANSSTNLVTDNYGTVGGGANNRAGDGAGTTSSALYATVGGGTGNTSSNHQTTVSGGWDNTASGSNATVGGGHGNTASGGWAAVGGGEINTAGGGYATVGGGTFNEANGDRATVPGGASNTASGSYATAGGGSTNTVSGSHATVGGGNTNTASNSAATVGGGEYNTSSGDDAAVGGGSGSTASGPRAAIGGGWSNTASGGEAAVGGGGKNTASGNGTTVAGGQYNTASGYAATVPGGYYNRASGDYSFAAGQNANANYNGAFVWADSTDAAFHCSANDQFAVRATGGVRIVQGVSTFAPTSAALQVEKASGGEAAWFYLTSASNNNPVMKLLKASTTSDFLAGAYKNGASETQKFHIDANGAYHAGADFSESLPAAGGKAGYEPGDVLIISAGQAGAVEKSSKPYDTAVIGVYSTEPGFVGGVVQGPEDIPVAVVGIVPVKASAENGAIAPGDLLATSATPGHVMQCVGAEQCFGRTIGKALERLDEGTGVIRILVSLQ